MFTAVLNVLSYILGKQQEGLFYSPANQKATNIGNMQFNSSHVELVTCHL